MKVCNKKMIALFLALAMVICGGITTISFMLPNFDITISAPSSVEVGESFNITVTGKFEGNNRSFAIRLFGPLPRMDLEEVILLQNLSNSPFSVIIPYTINQPGNFRLNGRLYSGSNGNGTIRVVANEEIAVISGTQTTPTSSESPSVTPTPSESPDATPTPSESPSVTPTPSESPSVTPTPSESPSVTPTPSESPGATPTPSESPSVTSTPSESPSATPIQTVSQTETPSETPGLTPSESPKPSPSEEPRKKYTLKIVNGIGSGDYYAGDVVDISAEDPSKGMLFSVWITSNGGTFEDRYAADTKFTMPSNDVELTALYVKTGKKSSGSGGEKAVLYYKDGRMADDKLPTTGGNESSYYIFGALLILAGISLYLLRKLENSNYMEDK